VVNFALALDQITMHATSHVVSRQPIAIRED